jgi:hypothetical protein
MPRLDTLKLKIITGKRGPGSIPRYEINSFEIDFDDVTGSNNPGGTLELEGAPQSFPHSLALIGPDQGHWDIESLTATYYTGDDSHTVNLGSVTLDGETKLNLKYESQAELIDV